MLVTGFIGVITMPFYDRQQLLSMEAKLAVAEKQRETLQKEMEMHHQLLHQEVTSKFALADVQREQQGRDIKNLGKQAKQTREQLAKIESTLEDIRTKLR